MDNTIIKDKMAIILKEQLDKLENISSYDEWNNWKQSTLVFVARIYDESTSQYKQFDNIHISYNHPNIPNTIKESKCLLESYIKDIATFGLPQKNKPMDKSIKFENNNIITQNQNIELNIVFETIKDEIPPKTIREIEEIAKLEEPKENKLQKVGEILKNTGVEVVSSTLAKVIGQTIGIC